MIPVNKALELVHKTVRPSKEIMELAITDAHGFILASDIESPIDMPPFRQSAMDGYAVKLNGSEKYKLIGEIKAGDPADYVLNPGEAVRIFTGAAVPDSADSIIIQEHIERDSNVIRAMNPVKPDMNIRPKGEQVRTGELALSKGIKLNAAAIGYISSLGIQSVRVYQKPKIALIITGNELQKPGESLDPGKIYESNANMLEAALNKNGIAELSVLAVKDTYDDTLNVIEEALNNHDMVLISGGISVGDYDFVGQALSEIGVNQVFYKVRQKPGKPLFFGELNQKYVFALPGNPASSLSCYYMYVVPAINLYMGNSNYHPIQFSAISHSTFEKKGDRAQFLKAIYKDGHVEILDGQNSSMLHTFALANALVYIPEDVNRIAVNDSVKTILIPQY
ncbi:MAG: molybdopterin molybdotransferase MoeA [Flavobacteriaceae bacterium]|nr:molybdopterin molybdotransferase MoeA [Flavobacteriaceae bacterium]